MNYLRVLADVINMLYCKRLFVLLPFLLYACSNSLHITLNDEQNPALYKPITIHIEGIDIANPFHPDSVKVDLIVTAPSGKQYVVPAFACQDVARYDTAADLYVPVGISKRFWEKQKMPNAGQKVVRYKPAGEWRWKVMLNPAETGQYKAHLEVVCSTHKEVSNELLFTVAASANKGFIRIAKSNPRAFEYDNGENFIPVGNDLSYALTPLSKDRLAAFKEWLDSLHACLLYTSRCV